MGAAIRVQEEKVIHGFLDKVIEPHHQVLEIGCGSGNYTVPVARSAAAVTAVDASRNMLSYLHSRLQKERLMNVQTTVGRLPEDINLTQKYDGVLTVGLLNYISDIESVLLILAAALKPGGWAIFNIPLLTVEGWIYALTERINRQRAYLHAAERLLELSERAGFEVKGSAPAGLTRGGLTLVIQAAKPA